MYCHIHSRKLDNFAEFSAEWHFSETSRFKELRVITRDAPNILFSAKTTDRKFNKVPVFVMTLT